MAHAPRSRRHRRAAPRRPGPPPPPLDAPAHGRTRRAAPATSAGAPRSKKQHADEVASILAAVGYDAATIDRTQRIIRKEGLGSDPQVQTHEDALCLVFLETQLAELADAQGDEKMVDIIQKTAAKMSPGALELAADLPMRDADRALIAGVALGLGDGA